MTVKTDQKTNEAKQQAREKRYLKEVNSLDENSKNEIKVLWEKYADARATFEANYNLFAGMTTSFQQQLNYLIKAKNRTQTVVARAVGIDARTLRGYSAGRSAPSMPTLISICIVLDLDVKQAAALLTSLGYCFLGTSKEHYAYLYLIEWNHNNWVQQPDTLKKKTLKERKVPEAEVEELKTKLKKCNEILTGFHIEERFHLKPRKKEQEISTPSI